MQFFSCSERDRKERETKKEFKASLCRDRTMHLGRRRQARLAGKNGRRCCRILQQGAAWLCPTHSSQSNFFIGRLSLSDKKCTQRSLFLVMDRFNFDNIRQRLLSKSYFSESELRRREKIFAKKLRGHGFNLSRSLFCTAAEMCEGANFAHGSQCRAAYAPTQKTCRHSRELKFFSSSREALFNEQFGFK